MRSSGNFHAPTAGGAEGREAANNWQRVAFGFLGCALESLHGSLVVALSGFFHRGHLLGSSDSGYVPCVLRAVEYYGRRVRLPPVLFCMSSNAIWWLRSPGAASDQLFQRCTAGGYVSGSYEQLSSLKGVAFGFLVRLHARNRSYLVGALSVGCAIGVGHRRVCRWRVVVQHYGKREWELSHQQPRRRVRLHGFILRQKCLNLVVALSAAGWGYCVPGRPGDGRFVICGPPRSYCEHQGRRRVRLRQVLSFTLFVAVWWLRSPRANYGKSGCTVSSAGGWDAGYDSLNNSGRVAFGFSGFGLLEVANSGGCALRFLATLMDLGRSMQKEQF